MAFETPQNGEGWDLYQAYLPDDEDIPRIELVVNAGEFTFTWKNTVLRTFDVGDGEFDHVLHRFSEEEVLFIFLKDEEYGETLKDELTEKRFPHHHSPILDFDVISLHKQNIDTSLDNGFKELLGD